MEIVIRAAEDSQDLEWVRNLFIEYADEQEADLCFQGFDEELETLPGKYAPPSGSLLLAFKGDKPIGCVALRLFKADVCEMKRMYVKPEFRTKGVGKQLAVHVIEQAKQMGYQKMWLDTLPELRQALRLYQSLGFNIIPPYYTTPLPETIFMELVL